MTTRRQAMGSERLVGIATVTIAGAAYFAAIIVALHFLRADYDPVTSPTSAYAVGPFGFLMTSAFLSMSLASLALVAGLYLSAAPGARTRLGLGLLAIWGVGVLVAMIFPVDLPGAEPTISGTIHQSVGPVAFLSLTVGVMLVSVRLGRDERWRPIYRPALALSMVMVAAFIGTFLGIQMEAGFVGLTQRILLVALVAWMLVMAFRLRSVALGVGLA